MKTWPAAGLGLGRGTPSIQPAAASEPRLKFVELGVGQVSKASRKYRGATSQIQPLLFHNDIAPRLLV